MASAATGNEKRPEVIIEELRIANQTLRNAVSEANRSAASLVATVQKVVQETERQSFRMILENIANRAQQIVQETGSAMTVTNPHIR